MPDELPPQEYAAASAGSVVRAEGDVPASALTKDGAGTIPAQKKGSFLLDRKELLAGYPVLRFSGGRGARVTLSYQEALVKDRFTKGNRNEIDVDDLQLRAAPEDEDEADAVEGEGTLGAQLEHIERDAIVKALEQTRYNKTAAAKLLGISFRALRYRIKKLEIES